MLAKNYVGSTSFIIDIVATVPVAEIVDLIVKIIYFFYIILFFFIKKKNLTFQSFL